FLGQGWEVVCMDNFVTGSPDNVAPFQARPGFRLVRHNVTEYIRMDGALDWVLHLASPASPRDYLELPIQTLKVGALGTHNALVPVHLRPDRRPLAPHAGARERSGQPRQPTGDDAPRARQAHPPPHRRQE